MINLSLFILEFKRSFKGLVIWSVALGLSLFAVVMIYPMVEDMFKAIGDMMAYLESIDSSLAQWLETFGGVPENGVAYFATEGALFLQLLGGIFAAIYGFNAIHKDDKEKTVEAIYVLPFSRVKILGSKWLNVMVGLFIFTVIQISIVHLGFLIVAPDESLGILWRFGLFDYFMFLMIAAMSMGLAVFLKPVSSGFIAIAVPFPLYILTMISFATDNQYLKALKYASPFTFMEPVGWLKDQSDFEMLNFIIFAGLSICILIASFIKFRKREIV